MSVEVREVSGRREWREFLSLPFRLHRGHARWVPPLRSEERRLFDPTGNRAFAYCDVRLALAWRGRRAVGRIAGIVNRASNEIRRESVARFGFLECPDDRETVHALLDHVESWARGHGASRLVGPMGFTDQDPEGLWIEGFQHEPTLATHANFEFLPSLLEQEGYSKEIDYVVYRFPLTAEDPPDYERVSRRIVRSGLFRLVPVVRRADVRRLARPVLELMNETFAALYGFVALDADAIAALAKLYVPVIDPRFLKVVEKDGRIVAFLVAVPNMDPGLRRAKGRLLPLGVVWIWRAARVSRQLDLLIGGVRAEHRGHGLAAFMGLAMFRSARAAGLEYVDSHLILEHNAPARREMERLGGRESKRYRIYQKVL